MRIQFLSSFEKDLNKVPSPVRRKVVDLIGRIEKAKSIRAIGQVKKLHGPRPAYRIRIGNYRLGVFVEGDLVQMARLLDRKDIYRIFP